MSLFHKSLQVLKKPVILSTYNKVFGVNNADKINDYVYLGNRNSANDIDFLREKGIQSVLNCTEDEEFNEYFREENRMRLAIKDSRDEENRRLVYSQIDLGVQFIEDNVQQKKIVLVHCYWGIMRSATIVTAWIMKHHKMNPQNAIRCVQEKRPKAMNDMYNFNDLLEEYYEKNLL